MSRYIWEKYEVLKIPKIETQYIFTNSKPVTDIYNLYIGENYEVVKDDYDGSYKFHLTSLIQKIELNSSSSTDYIYNPPKVNNLYIINSGSKLQQDWILEIHPNGTENDIEITRDTEGKSITLFQKNNKGTFDTLTANKLVFSSTNFQEEKGHLLGYVSSNISNSFPNDNKKEEYWYTKIGYDNIDITNIFLSDDAELGYTTKLFITAQSATYQGTISYVIQQQINEGDWEEASITTNKEILISIPTYIKTLRFRGIAKDNLGYQQNNYVYSSIYTFSQFKIFLGINGIAKKINKIYMGINNHAREISHIYIGINNLARKIK